MPTLQWVGKDEVVNHQLDMPFCVLNKVSSFRAPEKAHTPKALATRSFPATTWRLSNSLLPEFEGKVGRDYRYMMVFDNNPIEGQSVWRTH